MVGDLQVVIFFGFTSHYANWSTKIKVSREIEIKLMERTVVAVIVARKNAFHFLIGFLNGNFRFGSLKMVWVPESLGLKILMNFGKITVSSGEKGVIVFGRKHSFHHLHHGDGHPLTCFRFSL